MPVTELAMSRPSRSSSWVSRTACSSGVRVGTVDSRQWWVRPRGASGSFSVPMPTPTLSSGSSAASASSRRVQPDDRLGVPHIDGQQHVSPPRCRRQMRSSPRSSDGGRMGQRPDRDPVRPGRGIVADRLQRDATGDLGQHRPGRLGAGHAMATATVAGVHVVEQDGVGPGPRRLGHLVEPVAFDLHHPAGPQARARRHGVGDR